MARRARPAIACAVRSDAAAEQVTTRWLTTSDSSRSYLLTLQRSPPRRWTTCSRRGAAWATTAARAICIAARRRSSANTAARFRAAAPSWRSCPASAAPPRRRSRRSASTSARPSSTATSSGCWRVTSALHPILPPRRRSANCGRMPQSLLPAAAQMAHYTQGLMDLGATVCLPRQPRCDVCPLGGHVRGAAQRPHRRAAVEITTHAARRTQQRVAVAAPSRRVLLVRRPEARRVGWPVEPARVQRPATAREPRLRPWRGNGKPLPRDPPCADALRLALACRCAGSCRRALATATREAIASGLAGRWVSQRRRAANEPARAGAPAAERACRRLRRSDFRPTRRPCRAGTRRPGAAASADPPAPSALFCGQRNRQQVRTSGWPPSRRRRSDRA